MANKLQIRKTTATEADKRLFVHTPLIESRVLSQIAGADVYLKLDNTQPTASFKIRGIYNLICKEKNKGCTSLVASSGGNAGLAAAYTARKLGLPIKVFVPSTTPDITRQRLKAENAEVIVHGDVLDKADAAAREVAKDPSVSYISPFDHPDIWDGHASIIEEVAADFQGSRPDLVILSVGGGGLLCGCSEGMKRVGWNDIPILAMETEGADCFNAAVKANKIVTLPAITSVAKCLGSLTVIKRAFEMYFERPILSELVTDKECIDSTRRFLEDHRILVEPACGAAIAPVYTGLLQRLQECSKLPKIKSVVILVCGGASVNLATLEDRSDRPNIIHIKRTSKEEQNLPLFNGRTTNAGQNRVTVALSAELKDHS